MHFQDRKLVISRSVISSKLNCGARSKLSIIGLSILTSASMLSHANAERSKPELLAAVAIEQHEAIPLLRTSPTDTTKTNTSPWFNGGQLSESGSRLWNAIRNADRFGVDRERLHYNALNHRLGQSANLQARLIFETSQLLDSSFRLLITEVSAGRVSPKESQRYWFDEVEAPDTEELLDVVKYSPAAIGPILSELSHNNRNIEPLLQKISEYRAIETAGGWPTLSEGPTIEPGDTSPRVITLRQRLLLTGDLESRYTNGLDSEAADTYSEELQQAVERFQARHGLLVDRLVGRGTLAALNVSVTERIKQIQLNIERHRWLPAKYADRHIVTNIPDYKLRVVENGVTTLEMPVVVGKPKHQTPVFTEDMQFLEVNPTWTVPRSITNKELVPKERDNPGSLQASGFRVLRRDGSRIPFEQVPHDAWYASEFPYTLRQGAGERNALGKVKFMMPNKYAIYLHDTPAKRLFGKQRRAFSHGCVRLGDPLALANHLLGSQGWSQDRIDGLFAQQKTKRVNLDQPIPNHIVYLTSWMGEDGTLQFRNDIYKLDATLKAALADEDVQRQQLVNNFSQFQPILAASDQ